MSAAAYIKALCTGIRSTEDANARKLAKKNKNAIAAPSEPRQLNLFVASEFPKWQEETIQVLKDSWVEDRKAFVGDKDLLVSTGLVKDKRVMQFVAMIKKNVESVGAAALDRKLLFDELATLNVNLDYIRRELSVLKIEKVNLYRKEAISAGENDVIDLDVAKSDAALPGQPTYRLV